MPIFFKLLFLTIVAAAVLSSYRRRGAAAVPAGAAVSTKISLALQLALIGALSLMGFVAEVAALLSLYA